MNRWCAGACSERSRRGLACIVGLALAVLLALPATADEHHFPSDFNVPGWTFGGAGGRKTQAERTALKHLPVIMVPSLGRDHTDWTGANPGNTLPVAPTSAYAHFIAAGFQPVELWMVDFARAGDQMTSLEEATDDLKFFIAAVMRYTGSDKVVILAHGTGCILSRLTQIKYNIAHWIAAEVYVAGPFHGMATEEGATLRGYPNAWPAAPGSELLYEILLSGETPAFHDPLTDKDFAPDTLTLRTGLPAEHDPFYGHADSPVLAGAKNIMLPGLDFDALRASPDAAEFYIPFLTREATPFDPAEDNDGDGYRAAAHGGPDCDDANDKIYPGAHEVFNDRIDQDCNGCDYHPELRRDGEVPLPKP